MPSVQSIGPGQFVRRMSAWLLIGLMLFAGSGTVIHSVAPGSPGPRLVADASTYACGSDHYHYQTGGPVCDCENHPSGSGCGSSPCDGDRQLCGSCSSGCERPPRSCGGCGDDGVFVSTSVSGTVISGPAPSTTYRSPCGSSMTSSYRAPRPYVSGGFYPEPGTPSSSQRCDSSAPGSSGLRTPPCMDYNLCSSWRNFYSWSYPFYVRGAEPLEHPYGVWYDNPFRFHGTSNFAQFALPAPIRAVDPYNYEIYWDLDNTHGLDLVMELTIEAPGHIALGVVGVGSITEVTPNGDHVWVFTLPAYCSPDTGLYIYVKDPSGMQQSYLLFGSVVALQSA